MRLIPRWTLHLMFAVTICSTARAQVEPKMLAVDPRALEYAPIPNMPICATGAIMRGDPRSGPSWVMLKLASGCRVPLHWHSANEDLVVISGSGRIMMKDGPTLEFAPGAYASLPAQHMHEASCSRTCVLFAIADGAYDIHYVDANGEEITAEEAMKRVTEKKPVAIPKRNKK